MLPLARAPLRSLFAFCFVVLVAFAVVGYVKGWVRVTREDGKATIEIQTRRIEEATEAWIDRGRQALDAAGEPPRGP